MKMQKKLRQAFVVLWVLITFVSTSFTAQVLLDLDTGDTVTASVFDSIDDMFTELYGRWTTLFAITGPVFSDGDGTYTDLSALSSTELLLLNGKTGALYESGGTDVAIADGGTGASTAAAAASALGVGTEDSPQFTGIELSHASDNTLTASSGVLSIEGTAVLVSGGNAGTPSAINLTNGTALPLSTGVTGQLPIANGGTSGINKLDATEAPGVTNDVDEGYVVGSVWVDISADVAYICLDNSDNAASWQEVGEATSSGNAISQLDSSSTITDTGSNGAWALVLDSTTVMSATSSGVSHGNLYVNLAVDGTSLHSSPVIYTGLLSNEDIDRGELVIIEAAGTVGLYDANVNTLPPDGVCIANSTSGNAVYFMSEGTIYQAAHGITVGNEVCPSETAGAYQDCADALTAWDTDGDAYGAVGKAVSANVIKFRMPTAMAIHN